ncbi:MAG: FtsX-like permease family protein [Deltaproteobacteria bacterium]|nr:FtsX-like permease family protein [Deltaproteobacteria bacterium]
MIMALRRVSLRHLAAHKLRTLLTLGGIALGVATVVSMRLMHESVSRSYERTVEKIAGKAALEITNGEGGVPEELLAEVRQLPGVGVAAASVQGFVPLPGHGGERLYVFGVDLLADQELRDYQFGAAEAAMDDPLVFLAQPDSIALSAQFLERIGAALEDRLDVLVSSGVRTLTVRASLDVRTGPASLFGGRFAVMDVFAAQRLFGLDKRFTQIDVGLADGAELGAVKAALERRVGGRGIVEEPRARGQTLERLLTSNRYGMTLAAMLAVVVGVYLIFNTMMITVAQREREIGCLRALGMRRGEVLRLVLVEALVLGAVGALGGVPLGYGLARGLSQAFALSLGGMYMMPVDVPEIRLDVVSAAAGVTLGLVGAVAAAIVPARHAVSVHPLEALRPAAARRVPPRAYGRAAAGGVALIAVVAILWMLRDVAPLSRNVNGSLAILGLLIGASLIVPAAVRGFALRVEPLLSRGLGPVGSLATRSIVDHIGRVAITCSAFLVSLAGALAVATWMSSFQRTLSVWMDGVFSNIDLVISSGGRPLSNDTTPLPGDLVAEIAALPEVARVDSVRIARITHEGVPTNLIATDARLWADGVRRLTMLDGTESEAYPRLLAGEAVAVNEAFCARFRKKRGDLVSLPTPSGELRLPITAVYFDPGFGDMGIVLMDRGLYGRLWRDERVSFIEPALRPGADRELVMETIRSRWGKQHALFVVTMEQFRGEADQLLNQTLLVAYPLVVIAIAIALLGVVNSLLASVLDRIREIGVLRAVGATRAQIARSIVIEATIIGLLGGVLAVAVGSVLGYVQVDVLFRGMFGMTVLYRYPTAAALFSLVAALLLAAASGYLPGRQAGRIEIIKALEYE